MDITSRLLALREAMEREGLDAYIVSGTDPHNSEYLPEAWKQREWMSGFTGSFGTLVVLKDQAGLWTDSRYFIQAEKQLKNSGIQLHKLRMPGSLDYPEWLSSTLPQKGRVGLDCFCISVVEMKRLKKNIDIKEGKIVENIDLVGDIWLNRPELPNSPLFRIETGVDAKTKIAMVRHVLQKEKSDYFVFSALDEIAWLYNIRCNDILYNPVAISYAIVGMKDAHLFVKFNKVSKEIAEELKQDGVQIHDYCRISNFLNELPKEASCCIDVSTLNYALYHQITSRCSVKEVASPLVLSKAIKNKTEIEGFRVACVKDGVAMTKFFYWLERNIRNHLTETEVSEQLTAMRACCSEYISDSFHNISAYGANAALPHYSALPGQDSRLEARGLYLVDSGGQYIHGTTDITRTVSLGELTRQEKEDYTIVLKGMIALSCAVFPEGTRGCNLDALARQPMWQTLRNFGHGTGHGIGFFLNVHEGPQSIRQDLKEQAILPGMVTSNEPGIYRENSHGIRHENMILCVPVGENEFGKWYGFETLTLCYFDTSALLLELLTEEEKKWINDYHKTVYQKLAPFLNQEEVCWLAKKTKEI